MNPGREYSGQEQKRVLISMIVCKSVLAPISEKWIKPGLFSSNWHDLVGSWCVDFFKKHGDAPKAAIRGLFIRWANKSIDRPYEYLGTVEQFIDSLSRQYEAYERDVNPSHALHEANELFELVSLTNLSDRLVQLLEAKLSAAEVGLEIRKYRQLDIGGRIVGTDPFNNPDLIKAAFDRKDSERLIKYPGALKTFFGDALSRGNFITLLGPEKRGKTWILMDMALRAVLQRRKVALFQIGDLSENQTVRRLSTMVAQKSIKPKAYRVPVKIEQVGKKVEVTQYDEVNQTDRLNWEEANEAFARAKEHRIKSKKTYFQLVCKPTGTVSVDTIYQCMEVWEQENDGWRPDVVVIDYADIMAAPTGFREQRDRINNTWERLRGLSLDEKGQMLVITATQATRASYKAGVISMSHVSEEKRKLAHVTGAIGLNQNSTEKADGIMRWNWVVLREEDYIPSSCVYVGQCLQAGRPVVSSCLPSFRHDEVLNTEKE